MSHRRRGRLAAVTAALALIAGGPAACGGGDEEEAGPSDVPKGAVAVVGDVEISRGELNRQIKALQRARRGNRRGDAEQLEGQALSTLLQASALEQEAAERGIVVTRAEARQRWETVVRRQFPNRRALRRFLGTQTERDIVGQLRQQMLAERVQQQLADEAGGSEHAATRDARREYRERWRERTACRESLTVSACNDPG